MLSIASQNKPKASFITENQFSKIALFSSSQALTVELNHSTNDCILSRKPPKLVTYAATRAAIAAIIRLIGEVTKPRSVGNNLTKLNTVPTPEMRFPTIVRSGPAAAAIAAIVTIIFLASSSSSENHSNPCFTQSINCCK